MRIKAALIIGTLFLLTVLTQGQYFSSGLVASIQVVPSVPDWVWLGYGPSTLSPPSEGIPVYTMYDELWIASHYSQYLGITLVAPNGTSVASLGVAPSTALLLHSFESRDPEGTWHLVVDFHNSSSYSMPIEVTAPYRHAASLVLTQYSLQNAQINLGFSLHSSEPIYGIQGCILPNSPSQNLSFAIPSSLGSGQVMLSWNGTSASTIAAFGIIRQGFSFWYEMYYTYSYANLSPNQTVSRDIETLRSSAVVLNQTSSGSAGLETENASLQELVNMRTGRYTLRGYFESASGISVEVSNILLSTNSRMVPFSSCDLFSVFSSNFTRQEPLNGPASTWPGSIYVMYDYNGVDAALLLALQLKIDRVDLVGFPGGAHLSGMSYQILPNPDILLFEGYNSSIYVIARQFPVQLSVTPLFGNMSYAQRSLTLTDSEKEYSLTIPVGKVVVQVSLNGAPSKGVNVAVSNGMNGRLAEQTDSSGTASFYLPEGNYQVATSLGTASQAQNITVASAQQVSVLMQFQTSPSTPAYLTTVLEALLVIGLLGNVWLWLIRPKTNRLRMR